MCSCFFAFIYCRFWKEFRSPWQTFSLYFTSLYFTSFHFFHSAFGGESIRFMVIFMLRTRVTLYYPAADLEPGDQVAQWRAQPSAFGLRTRLTPHLASPPSSRPTVRTCALNCTHYFPVFDAHSEQPCWFCSYLKYCVASI